MEEEIKKRCTKCGEEKCLDEYHSQRTGRYGKKAECKRCINKRSLEWTNNNKDRKRHTNREWYKRTDRKEYNRKWREAHPEYMKNYRRKRKETD